MNVEHHMAAVNGIRLHYVTAGRGPLVMLLHGFPEFWYGWKNQIPALSQKFKVAAPDLRGYNDSDKPRSVKSYGAKIVAKDIRELIYAFDVKKAHIIGHDWGGAIAWTLAQHYPECIDRLIVLNCPLPQLMWKHFRTNMRQLRRSWYIFYFQIPWLPEKGIGKDLNLFFQRALRGWAFSKQAFTDADITEYVKAFQKPHALTGAINYYRAAFRTIADKDSRHVKPIAADTLLIWGENDKALGKELTYGMEKYFTGRFHIKYIPDCSHWVQHEYPELVNRMILEFLNGRQ
ncbi:MAG TPA: alpha/beta hydrolase [Chitinophagales bacterium]|nr:alpha/beta hydrolase [Chitinophagales bacterium]